MSGLTAQTVANTKAIEPESLLHFLLALPSSFEAQLFYAMLIGGAAGMLANYTVKWFRKDSGGGLLAYLFRDHVKRTMLSVFSMVGAALGVVASGVFETPSGEFVGWFIVLYTGATTGFTIDAVANKGKRAEWSAEKRAEVTATAVEAKP